MLKNLKAHPLFEAAFVSFIFLIAGILSWIFTISAPYVLPALMIFYVILVINTFFSIKLFSSITPPGNKMNNFIDVILFFLYIISAFYLPVPTFFMLFMLLLFIVATLKYACLLQIVRHTRLLKKKIIVDLMGCVMCAVVLIAMILGYENEAAWGLAIVFAIANFLLFFVWPLYKLD